MASPCPLCPRKKWVSLIFSRQGNGGIKWRCFSGWCCGQLWMSDFWGLELKAYFLVQVNREVGVHGFSETQNPAKGKGRRWGGVRTHCCRPGSWLGLNTMWCFGLFVRNLGLHFSSGFSRTWAWIWASPSAKPRKGCGLTNTRSVTPGLMGCCLSSRSPPVSLVWVLNFFLLWVTTASCHHKHKVFWGHCFRTEILELLRVQGPLWQSVDPFAE